MNPRTTEKKVSASDARVSAAHQAATSPAVTWLDGTARSIVPWLTSDRGRIQPPRRSRWHGEPLAPACGHFDATREVGL
jgi:hypothetical protein